MGEDVVVIREEKIIFVLPVKHHEEGRSTPNSINNEGNSGKTEARFREKLLDLTRGVAIVCVTCR